MQDKKKIYVVAGGTNNHIANHLSLTAPAYGTVGNDLSVFLKTFDMLINDIPKFDIILIRTKMAVGSVNRSEDEKALIKKCGLKEIDSNEDVRAAINFLVKEELTRGIVMSCAICDFKPVSINGSPIKDNPEDKVRLDSSMDRVILDIEADDKIISGIRSQRKDIFVVGFKTVLNVSYEEAYERGLRLLKTNSLNLVLVNDPVTRLNMVITPEEYPYLGTRGSAIAKLADITIHRICNTFSKTSLIEGEMAQLNELGGHIPPNFIDVMKHLINRGVFKAYRGRTAGHFGCKVDGKEFQRISSKRFANHNNIFVEGMVKIFVRNGYGEIAAGFKPSAGEKTQSEIYRSLGDKVHSIVHFHSPPKEDSQLAKHIPVAQQMYFECGSNECAINTASHMRSASETCDTLYRGIYAVNLEGHGPNIAFHKDVKSTSIIAFIEECFDLDDKTGGAIKEPQVIV